MRNPEIQAILSLKQIVAKHESQITYLTNVTRGNPRVGGTLIQRLGSWYRKCMGDWMTWWPFHLPPGAQRSRYAQVNQEMGGWLFSTALVAKSIFDGNSFPDWTTGQVADFMTHLETQRRQGIVATWHDAGMALSASATNASTWRADSTFTQGVTDFVTTQGGIQVPNHVPHTIAGAVADKFNPLQLG